MSEDRNEAGQFTEPLTGQAGVEAAQGYVPMPSDEPPEQPASDIDTEVARLRASRPPEEPIEKLEYLQLDTGPRWHHKEKDHRSDRCPKGLPAFVSH
jgi:hypothetical protein